MVFEVDGDEYYYFLRGTNTNIAYVITQVFNLAKLLLDRYL